MKIDVLGSGSAFSTQRNTSAILISEGDNVHWMVDCGPTIPRALWQRNLPVDTIDVLYFTHVHPDHCSGLVALLNQWKSFHRTKPLVIYARAEQRDVLMQLAALAYWPAAHPGFELIWQDIQPEWTWRHWRIRTADTQHEIPNSALRIDSGPYSLFYSGDGRPTPQSRQLMAHSTLAFQECASWQGLEEHASHGDFPACEALSDTLALNALGLYHCQDADIPAITEACAGHPTLFVSEDGMTLDLAHPRCSDKQEDGL